MTSDRFTFKCHSCGSTKFEFPSTTPQATDTISCAGCGASARYSDLQAETVRLAKQHVQQALKNAFKGARNINLKLR